MSDEAPFVLLALDLLLQWPRRLVCASPGAVFSGCGDLGLAAGWAGVEGLTARLGITLAKALH